jgi:DNA-binding response OmpR family regulator
VPGRYRRACHACRVRLLVVEDEARMATALQRGLTAEGFVVDVAGDGPTGLALARTGGYDAMVLDVMLPGLSGYRLVRQLRAERNWLPVLMLSAKDGEYDQADGLDCGADDYLTKPFSYVVLLARLRALLRRGAPARPAVLTVGDLVLDPATRTVTRAGTDVGLTGREYALLEYLMRRAGRVVSKLELLDHVWDAGNETAENAVEVYVGYLRRKIGRDLLETVRGAGYRIPVPAGARTGAGGAAPARAEPAGDAVRGGPARDPRGGGAAGRPVGGAPGGRW